MSGSNFYGSSTDCNSHHDENISIDVSQYYQYYSGTDGGINAPQNYIRF